MSLLSIEGSVGVGGRNNPIDVAIIQRLLKAYFGKVTGGKGRAIGIISPAIKIDGECSQTLMNQIKTAQTTALGMKKPDGRVDPMGKTLKKLIAQTKPTASTMKGLLFGPTPTNTGVLTKVDPKRFRKYFIKQPGLGLTITKGEDLLGFFKFLQNDPDIKDIRWAAYMIATALKETGRSFKPIVEHGKGGNANYGKSVQVVDHLGCRGPKNAVYTNAYYGRGYVQLTHDTNYKAVGKAYGIGDELHINPARALEPKIAYFATSHGMRFGIYTGRKLSDYINGNKCDYKGARAIINGNDCDLEIANNAKKIEILLRLCADSSVMISNDHLFHFC